MNWKEWAKGWALGNLLIVAMLFVYGQYQFNAYQRVFFVGLVNGQWEDPPAQTPHARATIK